MAEVMRLLVSDVHLDNAIPHLIIKAHPHRRLKTKVFSSLVPLVGGALSAAEQAVIIRIENELCCQVMVDYMDQSKILSRSISIRLAALCALSSWPTSASYNHQLHAHL